MSETQSVLQLVVLLLSLVLTLGAFARRLPVPYPIVLVLGGLALSFVPGLPAGAARARPDLHHLPAARAVGRGVRERPAAAAAQCPPDRAARGGPRGRHDGRCGVGGAPDASRAFPGRPRSSWAPWSPPPMRSPRRRCSGGSAYRAGSSRSWRARASSTMPARWCSTPRRSRARVTGEFSASTALYDFVYDSLGGITVGVAVAFAVHLVSRLTRDAVSNVALTVLAAYISWILGEKVGASAVLVCVACGLTMRRHYLTSGSSAARVQCAEVWGLFVFVLNGFIFVLLGPRVAQPRGGPASGWPAEHCAGHRRRVCRGGAGAPRLAAPDDVRCAAPAAEPAGGTAAPTRMDGAGRLDRDARHRDAGCRARRSRPCRSPARRCRTGAASSSSPSR